MAGETPEGTYPETPDLPAVKEAPAQVEAPEEAPEIASETPETKLDLQIGKVFYRTNNHAALPSELEVTYVAEGSQTIKVYCKYQHEECWRSKNMDRSIIESNYAPDRRTGAEMSHARAQEIRSSAAFQLRSGDDALKAVSLTREAFNKIVGEKPEPAQEVEAEAAHDGV